MSDAFTLTARLVVLDQQAFTASMNALGSSVQNAARQIEGAGRQVGSAGSQLDAASKKTGLLEAGLRKVGDTAARLGTYFAFAGITQAVGEVVNEFVELDEQITNALSIQNGEADRFEGQMRSLARTLSKDLGISVGEVATGFYELASAGQSPIEQLEHLPIVAKFAKAGLTDLTEATEQLAQATAIFAPQGEKMADIADLLAEAANESQATIDDFALSLTNKAGTAAVTFGQSMEDTVAILAAFAERGIKGKVAGEQFAILLRDLAIRATTKKDAFDRMGIAVLDASGNMLPIIEVLGNMQRAFAGLSDEQETQALLDLGFTLRSQNVIKTALAVGDGFGVMKDKLSDYGGAVDRVVAVQLTSLQAKLDILRARTIDLGITGLEKLFEAGEFLSRTFGPALAALEGPLKTFARGVGDILIPLASLAAVGIREGLQFIAGMIEEIGEFASRHETAVRILGTALAGIAAAHVVAGIAGLVGQFGAPLLIAIGTATEAVLGFVARIATIAATSGPLSAMKDAWQSVGDTIRRHPVAAVGLFAAALAALAQGVRGEQKEAEEFARSVISAFDTSTLSGMEAASGHLRMQQGYWKEMSGDARGFKDFLKTTVDVIPGVNFKGTSADLKLAAEEAKKLADQIGQSKFALDNLASFSGGGLGVMGPLSEDARKVADGIRFIAEQSGLAAGPIQLTADQLARVAKENNIDLTGPWEKWAPELARAAVLMQEASGRAQILGPTVGDLGDEMLTLSDDTKSAAEQMEALSGVIDDLIGRTLSAFNSETSFQSALSAMSDALKEFGPNLDSTTEAGREVRDALSGAAQEALNYAKATSSNAGEYAAKLYEVREALIGVIQGQVGSRQEAERIVDQLGLIPSNIQTVVEVGTENLDDVALAMDRITQQERIAQIRAEADTSLAEAQLRVLISQERVARLTAAADVAEAEGDLETAAKLRTAAIRAEADWRDADRDLNEAARRRNAPVEAIPDAATAEQVLGNAARSRDALITGGVVNGPAVDEYMGYLARLRAALINGQIPNYDLVNRALDELARARTVLMQVWYVAANQPNPDGTANLASAARGGIFEFYGRGGMREDHVAQIAPAGSWRIWAEPETGGEAYIPLAASKRQRSIQIWQEVGRRLGMEMRSYASGGGYGAYAAMRGGTAIGCVVNISPNAVKVEVATAVGADPQHLAALVRGAVKPALDEFTTDLVTAIQRRKGRS